jgi:hypothetical protein
MRFICAQPDKPLFVWQLQTLLTSMLKLQISKDDIYFLVLLEDGAPPSAGMRALEKYAQLFYFEERPQGRFYVPSSKPYLFGRFFEAYPENVDHHFLFVESDMLIYKIPYLPADDTWYWSNASAYLETALYEHLLGFPPTPAPAFGFHCYGKGADHDFWYKVERDAQQLYIKMITENISANRWICEMRSWMWNAASRSTNKIHPQLTFNDGKGLGKPGATLYHQISMRGFRKRDYDHLPAQESLPAVGHHFCLYDYLQAIRDAGLLFNHGS